MKIFISHMRELPHKTKNFKPSDWRSYIFATCLIWAVISGPIMASGRMLLSLAIGFVVAVIINIICMYWDIYHPSKGSSTPKSHDTWNGNIQV